MNTKLFLLLAFFINISGQHLQASHLVFSHQNPLATSSEPFDTFFNGTGTFSTTAVTTDEVLITLDLENQTPTGILSSWVGIGFDNFPFPVLNLSKGNFLTETITAPFSVPPFGNFQIGFSDANGGFSSGRPAGIPTGESDQVGFLVASNGKNPEQVLQELLNAPSFRSVARVMELGEDGEGSDKIVVNVVEMDSNPNPPAVTTNEPSIGGNIYGPLLFVTGGIYIGKQLLARVKIFKRS